MLRRVSPLAALGLALAWPHVSSAQDGMSKATAEALFTDAKKLATAGDYAAACPKFAASQKLDPMVGTELNLADCYEKAGQTASAWAEFRGVVSAARAAGSKDPEQLAAHRARALESKLSYLTIATSGRQPPNIQISRDGSVVDPAVLGTAIPIDPGRHTVEAVAPGKRKWSVAIEVGVTASRVTVNVPDLADGASPQGPTAPAAPDPARYAAAQRGVGIGVGVIGLMGVAAGTVFGLKASSDWAGAKSHCRSFPQGCDSIAVTLAQDARGAGNAATVAFVIGGVGLVGGAVIYLTAPRSPTSEKALSIQVLPSTIALQGRF